jgi:hypothetical protein
MDWLAPFACSFVGCFSVLPTALAAAAVVDVLRVRAEWWWIPVALIFPVIGPLAYFAVAYGPWSGGARPLSPVTAQRRAARRRLRELEVQLGHWRGPALLAEAGEQLLDLRRWREAEKHLREAHQAGADPAHVNYPLAQLLQVRGERYAEALPLLAALVAVDPDHRLGSARLQLARCLDETGDDAGAERELREVLSRRNPAEARVRLARLLLRRGEGREASELISEVVSELPALPRYLRRGHRPWARAAARLKTGREPLPKPELEGAPPRASRWVTAAVALGAVAALGLGVLTVRSLMRFSPAAMMAASQQLESVRQELLALDEAPGARDESEPTAEELDRYLALRERIAAPLADHERERASLRRGVEAGGVPDVGASLRATAGLLGRLADELRAAGFGPERFERLTVLVEWRFLGRDEAIGWAVPDHFRSDWRSARQVASWDEKPYADAGPAALRSFVREREAARLKVEDLEARAREARELGEPTRELLEARRARIAALDPSVLEPLLDLLDTTRSGSVYDYE